MAINTLGEATSGAAKIYSIKDTPGSITLPAGVYNTAADAEWGFSDSLGNGITIPAGNKTISLPNGLSAINYGSSPTVSKFSKGTGPAITSPMGLFFDGSKYIIADKTSKFTSSTDGITWTDYANLGTGQTASPYVAASYYYEIATSGTGGVTTFTSPVLENDVIVIVALNQGSLSTPTGYTSFFAQTSTNSVYSYGWYKVVGSTPDTGITVPGMGSNGAGFGYKAVIVRGAKIVGGVPQFAQTANEFYNGTTNLSGRRPFWAPSLLQGKPGSLALLLSTVIDTSSNFTSFNDLTGFTAVNRTLYSTSMRYGVAVYSKTIDTNAPNYVVGITPGETPVSVTGYGYNFFISFEPVALAPVTSAICYNGTGFNALNGATQKFGVAANPPVSFDVSASSISVDSALEPFLVNSTNTQKNGNAAITYDTIPSGTAVGDMIIIFITTQNAGPVEAHLTDNGYKKFTSFVLSMNSFIYTKIVTAADLTTGYVVPGISSGNYALGVAIYRNATELALTTVTKYASTSSGDYPALPYVQAGSIVMLAAFRQSTSGFSSYPTGYSEVVNATSSTTNQCGLFVCKKAITADGVEDPSSVTFGNAVQYDLIGFVISSRKPINATKMLANAGSYFAYGPDYATSSNGTTWTKKVSPLGTSVLAMAYGNGVYVMAGSGGALATSTDGTTWTVRSSGVSADISAIEFIDDKFGIVTTTGSMAYSVGGITWFTGNGNAVVATQPSIVWTKTSTAPNTSATLAMEFDAGVKKGDLVLITTSWVGSASYLDLTANAGWTRLSSRTLQSNVSYSTYYKFMDAVVDSGFTVNGTGTPLTGTTNTFCYPMAMAAVVVRGVDSTASFIAKVASPGSSTTTDSPAVTTTGPSFVVAVQVGNTPSASWTTPAGYSNLVTSADSTKNTPTQNGAYGITLATKYVSSATVEDPSAWLNNGTMNSHNLTIAIPLTSAITTSTSQSYNTISYAKPNFVAFGTTGQIISLNTQTGAITTITDRPTYEDYSVSSEKGRRVFAVTSAGTEVYAGLLNETIALTQVGEVTKLNG